MIFHETGLAGAYIIELDRLSDSRGFFARTWCEREFVQHGLPARMVQASLSFNEKKGTLRGMHYQAPPSREGKLVRCTAGAICDVIVDIRLTSNSFLRHVAVTLTAENRQALYIPPGFAHGFQTLADNTEVAYMMTDFYQPECARGLRWNDPVLGITWPEDARTILERDNGYPDFGAHVIREFEGYA
jgi:dTDP-4-dehydrorhamnose 3,5-epimerase